MCICSCAASFGIINNDYDHTSLVLHVSSVCVIFKLDQDSCQCTVFMFVLFALAASDEVGFTHHPTQLLCGTAGNKIADWMYETSEHSRRQRISVYGNLSRDHADKYFINRSSLIINEVKASDAGIYICGHGRQLYHKVRLNVSGV